jgi:catechol 2,3-dioxygenase-like lactoylglutathione lyase family enzyme
VTARIVTRNGGLRTASSPRESNRSQSVILETGSADMSEQPHHCIVSILPCTNIEASTEFYARLGLTLHGDYGTYRILTDGNGWLLHLSGQFPLGWLVPGRNPNGLYLYVQEVDGFAARINDLLNGTRPEHKPWGMYEFALSDPDGTLVRVGWPSRLMRASSAQQDPAN